MGEGTNAQPTNGSSRTTQGTPKKENDTEEAGPKKNEKNLRTSVIEPMFVNLYLV
jgi:hypothetical protein